MNQPTKLKNCFTLAAMPIVVLFLSGCIPLPYTNPTSAEVRGRVLDRETSKPIEGAIVALEIQPKHLTKTDNLGCFRLSATHKWHFFVTIQLAACPPTEDRFDSTVFITHPEYSSERMNVTTNHEFLLFSTNRLNEIKKIEEQDFWRRHTVPVIYRSNKAPATNQTIPLIKQN